MLSGDIKPTSGDAFINGHSVLTDLHGVRKHIGYCPQFDPLLDLMTGREHLCMYARLKGVPKKMVNDIVDEVLIAVGLRKYADVVAGVYSGGNKRKLALAIALVSCLLL
jgi:ABC-type multidrug transport system ATPase subunit